ncbi:MAG: GntR family transcriptional regulator [Ruminococcaceae bacterium]|nr:GntR family transcriptional regulator [Oscillospiraceae bacterium]
MSWIFHADQPIYLQLRRYLTEAIVTGVYAPGQRLPSVRELAMEAGVNPNTMQRALTELEQDGLISAQATVGHFVTSEEGQIRMVHRAMAVEKAKEFLRAMQSIGCSPREAIALLEKIKEEHHEPIGMQGTD